MGVEQHIVTSVPHALGQNDTVLATSHHVSLATDGALHIQSMPLWKDEKVLYGLSVETILNPIV